ncbi:MAG TPA: hypothetical protein VLQ93_23210 [Myxococcaceae bacterium]|nr:hypothetical protein [Myxococcaceae bacterium]
MAGVVRHYGHDDGRPQLLPTPLPLVHALRRVAGRTLNAGEEQVEALLVRALEAPTPQPEATPAEGASASGEAGTSPQGQGDEVSNVLGWNARHLAPPLVARWLMTRQSIGWLRQVSDDVRQECLRRFEQHPAQHEWVAFAFYTEGHELEPAARATAAASWRRVVQSTGGRLGTQGALALMGTGVLEQLSDEEARQLASLARPAEPKWRHRVFEVLAEASERHGFLEPWRAALDGLLDMCADEVLDAQERLKAALLALRRASASSRPERSEYLQRLATLASRPPFSQNVALRRELRRLGLSPAPDSKGEP